MAQKEQLTRMRLGNKGMALYLVLAVLLITILVANIFLSLVLSQTRLTHHQVTRTQAYYSARLGMNYAIAMLANNDADWQDTNAFNHSICRDSSLPPCGNAGDHQEPSLPQSINGVTIFVGERNKGLNNTTNISIVVNYTLPYDY